MELPRTPGGVKFLSMVTIIRCLAITKGEWMSAAGICQRTFPEDTLAREVLKVAVTAGSLSGTWGSQLSAYRTLQSEFIEALRPTSIIARMSGVRRVPFRIRAPRTTSSSTVGWVGAGAPKRVSELSYDEVTLGLAKTAGIVVVSQELAQSSDPNAEAVIRADLVASVNRFVDGAFVDPSNTAVVDVHPGSMLSGVTPIVSVGTSAANVATDLNAAVAALVSGGSQLTAPYWIMRPATAVKLALLRDSSGGPAYPGIGYNGGELAGIPALTSNAVPSSVSGGTIIILCDAAEILLAIDDQVEIDVSQEASLQMDSAPSSGASAQISLFQSNLLAIRAERAVNWAPRRSASAVAAYIDQVML